MSQTLSAAAAPLDRYLTIDGLRIHYLEWEPGGTQPLILLHGIARMAHAFDHLAPHLSSRYRVLAVDMRGHGDSGWDPRAQYMVEDYLADIEGLVQQLKLRDIVFWGNSTGGRVAQVFAGSHPQLVAAVISEDVGAERPAAISDGRAKRMASEENGWASKDELFAQVRTEYPRTADAILRALVEHGSKRRADGRLVWKRDPAILRGFVPTELWAAVRRIEAPIMYVLGGASTIVPAQAQEQLRRALPQAQFVSMAGLGHYPSDEKPLEFLAIVDRFLAG